MYIGGDGQTRAGEGNNTGMKLSSMSWNVQMQIMGEPTPHCALWILKHNHGQSGKHLLQYKILPHSYNLQQDFDLLRLCKVQNG